MVRMEKCGDMLWQGTATMPCLAQPRLLRFQTYQVATNKNAVLESFSNHALLRGERLHHVCAACLMKVNAA